MTSHGDFWHFYGPHATDVTRRALVESINDMLITFAPETQARFNDIFAIPMVKQFKVRSWQSLPMDKLADLHDLCARTQPTDRLATGEPKP